MVRREIKDHNRCPPTGGASPLPSPRRGDVERFRRTKRTLKRRSAGKSAAEERRLVKNNTSDASFRPSFRCDKNKRRRRRRSGGTCIGEPAQEQQLRCNRCLILARGHELHAKRQPLTRFLAGLSERQRTVSAIGAAHSETKILICISFLVKKLVFLVCHPSARIPSERGD